MEMIAKSVAALLKRGRRFITKLIFKIQVRRVRRQSNMAFRQIVTSQCEIETLLHRTQSSLLNEHNEEYEALKVDLRCLKACSRGYLRAYHDPNNCLSVGCKRRGRELTPEFDSRLKEVLLALTKNHRDMGIYIPEYLSGIDLVDFVYFRDELMHLSDSSEDK